MADRSTRRRRSRRRKIIAGGAVVAVIVAGGGTAWAMAGSDGTSYRTATVASADVEQTVDADGSLTSQNTAAQSFAAAGTVNAVLVKTGQHVIAGQTLATLSRASLEADVTSAKQTLAQARQTLADNEAGQSTAATGSSGGSGTGGTSTGASTTSGEDTAGTTVADDASISGQDRSDAVLLADTVSTDPRVKAAEAAVTAAQKKVVSAQSALDGYVSDLTSACTTSADTEMSVKTTAESDGTVSGDVDDASVVTIADDATTSDNPQTVESGGTWSFAGLEAGHDYTVVEVPVVDDGACTSAISKVSAAKGSDGDDSASTLYGALAKLSDAVTQLTTVANSASSGSASGNSGSGSTGSGSGSSGSGSSGASGSGSGSPGSGQPSAGGGAESGTGSGTSGQSKGTSNTRGASGTSTSGTSNSGSASTTTTTPTAADIAADQKAIDAAKAALAVARNDMHLATLTTPISGTVASVDIDAGSSVAASSSSQTIVVTTDDALSVPVDVSLAKIGLVKVGESASVTVDGQTSPLLAKVSMIGLSNESSSSGTSSEYQVTVVLDERSSKLFDGMGASVSIAVGQARNVTTVPVSAVTTTGTTSTVEVVKNGTTTPTRVTLGVEGDSRVQVTGLKTGQTVALADLDEALPSSDSDSTANSSLTGGFGGTGNGGHPGGGTGAGPGGGGPP